MNRFATLPYLMLFFVCSGSAVAADTDATEDKRLAQVIVKPQQSTELSTEADLIYRVLVAELAGKRGQLELALDYYLEAMRGSDDPRLAERTSGIALFMANHEAALEAAQHWHSLSPENPLARQSLALALLRNKQIDAAIEHLELVRDNYSDEEQQGWVRIATLLRQVDDGEVVFQTMDVLRERHAESPFVLYHYALAAVALENYEQAKQGLNEALAINPKWGQAQLLRSQIMQQLGETDAALAALDKAVADQPDDDDLRMGYARQLIGVNRLEDAREQLQLLAEHNPDNAEALYALGLLASETEQYDEAADYFMQVLKLGARVMDCYYELGKIEELRENFQQAREWYERVQDQGRYLSAQIRLATTLAREGDYIGMSGRLVALREQYPDNAVALFLAEAEIMREEKRYQDSFDTLTRALGQFADDKDLLYSRALVAEKLDRIDMLERDLRTIIEADPDNGHALNALGYTLADRTERYQEALDYLERAIQLLPDDAAVLDSMGWVKYRLGSYEKSLQYLRRAYELNTDPEIASHLSEVLWATEQRDEAQKIWQRAIEEHPDSEYLLRIKEKWGLNGDS